MADSSSSSPSPVFALIFSYFAVPEMQRQRARELAPRRLEDGLGRDHHAQVDHLRALQLALEPVGVGLAVADAVSPGEGIAEEHDTLPGTCVVRHDILDRPDIAAFDAGQTLVHFLLEPVLLGHELLGHDALLCLAAGTGLAPILALAEAALRRGYKRPVNLVFSARSREDVYSQGMMAWWRTKHRNFDYKITLTCEQAEGFQSGRIDTVLPQLFPDLSKHSIFAAGSTAFVDACVETVKKLGAQPELIHTEGFFSQQIAQAGEDDPFKLPF